MCTYTHRGAERLNAGTETLGRVKERRDWAIMAGEVPNDAELQRVTLEILGAADLETFTKKAARRHLENKLGLCHTHPSRLADGLCTPSVWIRKLIRKLVREYKGHGAVSSMFAL